MSGTQGMNNDDWLPASQYKTYRIKTANPGRLDSDENYVMWESLQKGHAFMVCNSDFPDEEHDLPGNKHDAANMKKLFTDLGYKVHLHHNLLGQNIKDELVKFTKFENEPASPQSAILYFGSHGDRNGVLGSDFTPISIDDIMEFFSATNCPKLKGKPKIIFIDACWGDKLTKAVPKAVMLAIAKKIELIPDNADIFLIHATSPGKISVGEEDGSWFTKQLCEEFYKSVHEVDLDTLLLKVTRRVKNQHGITAEGGTKQTPTVTKQGVDKKFYFCPGYVQEKSRNDQSCTFLGLGLDHSWTKPCTPCKCPVDMWFK